MSSTKAAVYPCLFPAFVPTRLEKSSPVIIWFWREPPISAPYPPVKTDHLVKLVLVWSRNVKETPCNSLVQSPGGYFRLFKIITGLRYIIYLTYFMFFEKIKIFRFLGHNMISLGLGKGSKNVLVSTLVVKELQGVSLTLRDHTNTNLTK